MPDDPKPEDSKPIFTTLPPGTTAEEAARLLREMVERHRPAGEPSGGESNVGDDGGEK
jgi:hypothetical protein